MIEIFCNADLKEVMLLKIGDSEQIIKIITDLFETKPRRVDTFKLNKTEYGLHPQLDELTLGEYIDLDMHIGDWDKMEVAMNVLYRPILVKLKDRYSIEEYNIDASNDVLDMPMDAVLSSIFFVEFRGRIIKNYDELFGQESGSSLEAIPQFSAKWGWYQSIYGLANGDIRRFEDITKLNIHKCFMILAFKKEKSEIEEREMKKKFK